MTIILASLGDGDHLAKVTSPLYKGFLMALLLSLTTFSRFQAAIDIGTKGTDLGQSFIEESSEDV